MPRSGQATSRATLRDVADHVGVSISTASLAFSGDARVTPSTRERVMSAAARLGYDGPDPLARSLRRGRSGVIGVVIGERLGYAFADPLAVNVLDGLAEEVGALGSALLLLAGSERDAVALATIRRVPVDAAVFATCGGADDPALDLLLRRGVPVVGMGGPHREGVHLVDLDDRGASAQLGTHLAQLGHTAAAVVTLPWRSGVRGGWLSESDRTPRGYDDARLRLLGLEDAIAVGHVWETSGNQREQGEVAGRALLSGPDGEALAPVHRPTAVVAQSDLLAVGVVTAAQRLGLRVPQDVSVVGFDGVETPWLGAAVLTTVVQPAAEKGRAAGRLVAQLLAGGDPGHVNLPVVVRIGTTTGPPAT